MIKLQISKQHFQHKIHINVEQGEYVKYDDFDEDNKWNKI